MSVMRNSNNASAWRTSRGGRGVRTSKPLQLNPLPSRHLQSPSRRPTLDRLIDALKNVRISAAIPIRSGVPGASPRVASSGVRRGQRATARTPFC